jgi:3-deoxy-D-manno-octulosonic acid kinase
MAEYRLLATLSEQGCRCRALCGPHGQAGPFYRADILIERIRGAKDLVALLKQGPIAGEVWHKIGKTVRQLHDAGVYHADLNSHNLLLDKEGKVWVIDFDKGAIRSPATGSRPTWSGCCAPSTRSRNCTPASTSCRRTGRP